MARIYSKIVAPLLRLPRILKQMIVLAVDVCLCILSTWLAFYLRLDEFLNIRDELIFPSLLSVVLAIPIFVALGLYRPVFRYASWPTLLAVGLAILPYGLVYLTVVMAIGLDGTPRTIGLIQPIVLFILVSGSRFLVKLVLVDSAGSSSKNTEVPSALIYGAGVAGRQLSGSLRNGREMQVLGFLDDNSDLQGQTVHGSYVFSPTDLPQIIEQRDVNYVLLAMPSAARSRRNQIIKNLSEYPVVVRTLPSVMEMADGRVSINDIIDLDVDDLLGRNAVLPDYNLLSEAIAGRSVLVTGAGGSIGGELSRQILAGNPEMILLVENNEYALFKIQSELESLLSLADVGRGVRIVPLLCSVTNRSRVADILTIWKPDLIFHAAAFKHVPLVEHNVLEGINNNVVGTLIVARAAVEASIPKFVLVSSDKAVRPTNVMGATKRLAEMVLQALQAEDHIETQFSMVRFGNVLASSGSVIPKFRTQIREGGPITLTHPEVTRYFMTIPEAANLVIQSSVLAKGGEVFVLDMGDPVKIIDLAKRMVQLSGLALKDRDNPEGDIEIQITGLRPGEKLYEELLIGGDPKPSHHPKIMKASESFVAWNDLKLRLDALERAIDRNDVGLCHAVLSELVTEFTPKGELVDLSFVERNATNPLAH